MNVIPKATSDDFYVGTGDRTEKSNVSDAAPIADQDTPELTKWDVESGNKDAQLAKIDPAVTYGEHSVIGYDNSEPEQLEDVAPVAFECIGVTETPGNATMTHPGQRRG
jgi:hypothetical protein